MVDKLSLGNGAAHEGDDCIALYRRTLTGIGPESIRPGSIFMPGRAIGKTFRINRFDPVSVDGKSLPAFKFVLHSRNAATKGPKSLLALISPLVFNVNCRHCL